MSALGAAAEPLVLGAAPSRASAKYAAHACPACHGVLPLRGGEGPEAVADGVAAGVRALFVLVAGLWLVSALLRLRASADAGPGTAGGAFIHEGRNGDGR
ncbi:hypothetical protein ACFU99_04730 [Streptomyces sp. NPDC057654]|uniref:hypothetical protein n=1 Tax=Streptomyces sp. NPDC057654 TaxID=3346196 RepID=UPI003676E45D